MKTAEIKTDNWRPCECGCPWDAHDDDCEDHEMACFGCAECWEYKERKE